MYCYAEIHLDIIGLCIALHYLRLIYLLFIAVYGLYIFRCQAATKVMPLFS